MARRHKPVDFLAQLEENLRQALRRCEESPSDQVRADPGAVIAGLCAEFELEPIEFDFDSVTRSSVEETPVWDFQGGVNTELHGQLIWFRYPFRGSAPLLRHAARTSHGGWTGNDVHDGYVEVNLRGHQLDQPSITRFLESKRVEIERFVSAPNETARQYNERLYVQVENLITKRKRNLDHIAGLDAELTVPLFPADPARRVDIPLARTEVRIVDRDDRREPSLGQDIYEDVLRTLTSFGLAMERLPLTAGKLQEPEIRDLALFVLNANYEGAAAGEVFHGAGKTDIRLTYRDRDAFIAEFKYWDGPKSVAGALDQVCSYTVWRNTKSALVVLVRDVKATTVIAGIDFTIKGHRQFQSVDKPISVEEPGAYVLRSNSDPDRLISLAVIAVVVPRPTRVVEAGAAAKT
ncbi:hypothetical protein AB0E12_30150 [Micromonospora chersina]|uniref:hypothetical protein n=1 Tax=Micromonospora chersina TaxID=47854 RepID=UPI00340E2056